MKKIIYIIVIVIIIGLIIWQNSYKNKEEDIEIGNLKTEETQNEDAKTMIRVYITGAVLNSGVIEVEDGSRIIDIINKAGGMLEEADVSRVNLAYKVDDGEKIYIPSIYDIEETDIISEEAGSGVLENENNSSKININKALRP